MASTSYSTPTPRGWKYDVFLSFRGEDTRKNFVDHLYTALRQKGIYTFKDDVKLERGEVISPALLKAIEESKFSIIIFSKDYASSTWCLDELVKILECKNVMGQTVLPVFYDMDPSDVRKQRGVYAEVFAKHEVTFKTEVDKVQRWRTALFEAANISGWDLPNTANGHEAELIKRIVGYILQKLSDTDSRAPEGLVGIDSRVAKVNSLLGTRTDDIRIVGICGMGGMGKSTIAKAVYDRISCQFEGHSYLCNVREVSKKHGLEQLQEQLLSEVLMESDLRIRNVDKGISMIRNRLPFMKVLVVLDDVDHKNQLETLVGDGNWFGPGSRIIITTRDVHVLTAFDESYVYEAEELNSDEAVELFSCKAFKNNRPAEGYEGLTNRVIYYAEGVPLALKVLGSFLCGRNTEEWKSALDRLEESPNRDIYDVLKISYDGLEYTEKKIFLDIACFFKGENKDYVAKILDGCGFYPDIGLSVLVQKSLINIVENKLLMHDLIQEMGWHIVYEESIEEPGNRSRLWRDEDIYHALMKNTATEALEGIFLDYYYLNAEVFLMRKDKLHLSATAFLKMNKLRLLKIRNVQIPRGLEHLSNELRLLDWRGYPLKYLPSGFQPEKLVELNMCHSRIEQLWKGVMHLDKLKFMDLSHSPYLTKMPEFTTVPNLEKLVLEGCTSLLELHPSIGVLKSLICLNLKNCKHIRNLPISDQLESLQILVLSGCSKLNNISEILGNTKCLSELYLDGTGIKELPPSIEQLSNLVLISLRDCKNLRTLGSSMCGLMCLKTLDLSGCSKLDKLPDNLGDMVCLKELHVDGTAIRQPPSSTGLLKNLQILSFSGCKGTSSKPRSSFFSTLLMPRKSQDSMGMGLVLPPLSGLWSLKELDLSDCNLQEGSIPTDLGCLSSLERLNLSRNSFVSIPESISRLSRLQTLGLEGCNRLEALPDLPSSITKINAHDCTSLEILSSPFTRYKNIDYLWFGNCYKLLKNQQSYNNFAATFLQSRLLQEVALSLSLSQVATVKHHFSMVQVHFASPIGYNGIFVPGREIPEWFSHQNNMGHSISIQLLPHWYNKLLGFAICGVFAAIGTTQSVNAILACCFKSNDAEVCSMNLGATFATNMFGHSHHVVDSHHVSLLFVPTEVFILYCNYGNNFPQSCTQFEASFSYYPKNFVPIKCGVHLLYKEDAKGMNQTKMIQYNSSDEFENFGMLDESFERSKAECSTRYHFKEKP